MRLSDYRGSHVVLEWVNPGCPYVRKHYNSAYMQGTQKEVTAHGAVWLAINSTENASADYLAPEQMDRWMQTQKALAGQPLAAATTRPYGCSIKDKS